MKKSIFVLLVVLLVISLSTNIYLFADIEEEVYPRPIGKDSYFKYMYIEMDNNNGIWEVNGFKNCF